MSAPARERVFGFVRDFFDANGRAPTHAEISAEFGFSKVRAWKVVKELVDQGRLTGRGGATQTLGIPGRVDLSIVPTDKLRAELARREAAGAQADRSAMFSGVPGDGS